jgi:hypothetical protein
MYKLTLDDPRLFLPVPVYLVKLQNDVVDYQLREEIVARNNWDKIVEVAFFAFPPDRSLDCLIPIYKTYDKDNIVLSGTGTGTPAFYALPLDQDETGRIVGEWECTFTNEMNTQDEIRITIGKSAQGYHGETDDKNTTILNISLTNNTITLTAKDDFTTYYLNGIVHKGKITGKWTAENKKSSGTWEGVFDDYSNRIYYSPSAVPLFHNINSKDQKHVYTTYNNKQKINMNNKVICRVWKNPCSLLILDYNAQPAQLIK